jgi:SAM-dependent MidA family methyltransferase
VVKNEYRMNLESFESFMHRCLHHPQRGYYSRNINSIGGHRADFTTAPQLSNLPAKAIASWAAQAMKKSKTTNLIEIGPGLGTLSQQILQHLPPLLRLRTKLHLVESSPKLSSFQKNNLQSKASYHTDIISCLNHCNGHAIIFSNELVDAFPVRIFQRSHDQWLELFLDHSNTPLVLEKFIQPTSLPISSAFSINFPLNQRVEVHESYHNWLKSWLPSWKRGQILTIDYGNTIDNLYHRRPNGSIRAYLLHQLITSHPIYQNQGLQDITSDVNFTDLTTCSSPSLTNDQLIPLSQFMKPFSSPSDSQLLTASDNFLCLMQTKCS